MADNNEENKNKNLSEKSTEIEDVSDNQLSDEKDEKKSENIQKLKNILKKKKEDVLIKEEKVEKEMDIDDLVIKGSTLGGLFAKENINKKDEEKSDTNLSKGFSSSFEKIGKNIGSKINLDENTEKRKSFLNLYNKSKSFNLKKPIKNDEMKNIDLSEKLEDKNKLITEDSEDKTAEKINKDFYNIMEHVNYINRMFIIESASKDFGKNTTLNISEEQSRQPFMEHTVKLNDLINVPSLTNGFVDDDMKKLTNDTRDYVKKNDNWCIAGDLVNGKRTIFVLNDITYSLLQKAQSHDNAEYIVYLMKNNIMYKLNECKDNINNYLDKNQDNKETNDYKKLLIASKELEETLKLVEDIFIQAKKSIYTGLEDSKSSLSKVVKLTSEDIIKLDAYQDMDKKEKKKELVNISKSLENMKNIDVEKTDFEQKDGKFKQINVTNMKENIEPQKIITSKEKNKF